jgi:hypothetical protein
MRVASTTADHYAFLAEAARQCHTRAKPLVRSCLRRLGRSRRRRDLVLPLEMPRGDAGLMRPTRVDRALHHRQRGHTTDYRQAALVQQPRPGQGAPMSNACAQGRSGPTCLCLRIVQCRKAGARHRPPHPVRPCVAPVAAALTHKQTAPGVLARLRPLAPLPRRSRPSRHTRDARAVWLADQRLPDLAVGQVPTRARPPLCRPPLRPHDLGHLARLPRDSERTRPRRRCLPGDLRLLGRAPDRDAHLLNQAGALTRASL